MTQVNFSGSGTDSITNQVGKGQGLKVGSTKINFAVGKIQLNDAETIGNFRTLKSKGAKSNECKSFAFKSTAKCIIEFQETFIDYDLINEWIILKDIQTELISIVRTETGLTVDIFDFTFIGSDNPNFSLSIEKGTRDSELETVFAPELRAVDTYTQTINVQGAKKLKIFGKATDGSGTATVTIEEFDPASNSWLETIHVQDLFTLQNGEHKFAQLGDTLSRIPTNAEIMAIEFAGSGSLGVGSPAIITNPALGDTALHYSSINQFIGHAFSSGENLFRIKVVVSIDTLNFSIGVTKVF